MIYIWEREWKWESEAGGGRDNECELNCVYHPLHCFSSLFNYHILVATVMCTALKRWNKSKATMMIWGRMLAYVFYYSFSVLKLSDSERVCVCEWVYKCIHFYLLSLQFFQTIHLFKHSFIRSFAHSFSLYSFIFVLFFSGWNYTSHVQTLGKQLFQVSLSFIFCCELCRKKTIRTHVRNHSNSFSSRSFGRDKIIEINNWLCNVVQSERVVESTPLCHRVYERMVIQKICVNRTTMCTHSALLRNSITAHKMKDNYYRYDKNKWILIFALCMEHKVIIEGVWLFRFLDSVGTDLSLFKLLNEYVFPLSLIRQFPFSMATIRNPISVLNSTKEFHQIEYDWGLACYIHSYSYFNQFKFTGNFRWIIVGSSKKELKMHLPTSFHEPFSAFDNVTAFDCYEITVEYCVL